MIFIFMLKPDSTSSGNRINYPTGPHGRYKVIIGSLDLSGMRLQHCRVELSAIIVLDCNAQDAALCT